MKKTVLIAILCLMHFCTVQAQSTKYQNLERNLERKIAEAEAKHRAAAEAKKREERDRARRREQQRRQQESQFKVQMNNLNSVNAENFMSGPQQQTEGKVFQAKTYKAEKNDKTPVDATPLKNPNDRQSSGRDGYERSNFGTPSYSGNDYTNGRYSTDRPLLKKSNLRSPNIPVDKNRYPSRYGKRQEPICLRKFRKPARILYNTQQQKITNASQKESQKNPQSPQNKTKSSDNSQSAPQTGITTQMVQVGQTSIKQKVLMKNGKPVFLDDSIHVTTQQNVYSPDLAPISDKTLEDISNGRRIKVDSLNYGTNTLSDEDNKTTNMANSNIRSNIQNKSRMTEEQLYQLARKDVANGFESFDNPSQWKKIYGWEKDRTIKLPAHSVSQKRTKK